MTKPFGTITIDCPDCSEAVKVPLTYGDPGIRADSEVIKTHVATHAVTLPSGA